MTEFTDRVRYMGYRHKMKEIRTKIQLALARQWELASAHGLV